MAMCYYWSTWSVAMGEAVELARGMLSRRRCTFEQPLVHVYNADDENQQTARREGACKCQSCMVCTRYTKQGVARRTAAH